MAIDLKSMPKLGFGMMRLPENDGVIDHEQVCRMVDKYLEAGLNSEVVRHIGRKKHSYNSNGAGKRWNAG